MSRNIIISWDYWPSWTFCTCCIASSTFQKDTSSSQCSRAVPFNQLKHHLKRYIWCVSLVFPFLCFLLPVLFEQADKLQTQSGRDGLPTRSDCGRFSNWFELSAAVAVGLHGWLCWDVGFSTPFHGPFLSENHNVSRAWISDFHEMAGSAYDRLFTNHDNLTDAWGSFWAKAKKGNDWEPCWVRHYAIGIIYYYCILLLWCCHLCGVLLRHYKEEHIL